MKSEGKARDRRNPFGDQLLQRLTRSRGVTFDELVAFVSSETDAAAVADWLALVHRRGWLERFAPASTDPFAPVRFGLNRAALDHLATDPRQQKVTSA